MTVVIPTLYTPLHTKEEPYTVYMVNEDDPKRSGHVQGTQTCPHCEATHHFRCYLGEEIGDYQEDGWHIDQYDCKCPACKSHFTAEFEMEMD